MPTIRRTSPLLIALALSACSSGPYGRNSTVNGTLAGAAAGAAVGAVAGSQTGGGAFGGAVVGAVAGGALGAVVGIPSAEPQVYYRDTRGACYYLDRDGRPVYNRRARC